MIKINVNGKDHELELDPETPLLWVIREHLGLTGTKFGCGISQCGACTVHVDGEETRSCVTPVSDVVGKKVVTIEGLSPAQFKPMEKAWTECQVPQCGYCQPGMIMTGAAYLEKTAEPTDDGIREALSGNLCRCGTYPRIQKAMHRAAELRKEKA